jgi:hypothetical protein
MINERLKKAFLRLIKRLVLLTFFGLFFLVLDALDDRVFDFRGFLLVFDVDFFLLADMSIDIDEYFISL